MTPDRPQSSSPVRVTNLIKLECYKAQSESAADSLRVLVVEDESGMIGLIHAHLAKSGHELIDVAKSGDDAVDKALRRRPDLILMDIGLGGMDGIEAAGEILAKYSCPLIFMSGMSDHETIRRAKVTGAQTFLVKPFSHQQLEAAVELAITQHRRTLSSESELAILRSELNSMRDVEKAVGKMCEHYGIDRESALDQLQAMARGRRCTLARAAYETVELIATMESGEERA